MRTGHFIYSVIAATVLLGCARQPVPAIDETPFRTAIDQYLQANNMAMRIKEVKSSPIITQDAASLTASMTHEKLGGPSVTWTFTFAKRTNGSWEVTRHQN